MFVTEEEKQHGVLDENGSVTYRLDMTNATTCSKCSGRGKINFSGDDNGRCYACGGCGTVKRGGASERFEHAAALEVLEETYRDAKRGVRAPDSYVAHTLGRVEGHPRHARAVEAFRALGYAL